VITVGVANLGNGKIILSNDDSCIGDEPPKKKLKKGELKLGTIFKNMKEKAVTK